MRTGVKPGLLLLLALCLGNEASRGDDMNLPENATAAFLGERVAWADARVELVDVQGLFGGRSVLVTGRGAVLVQVVEVGARGLQEKWYARVAREALEGEALPEGEAPAEMRRLLETAIAHDFSTIRSDDRPGLPDEARMRIILTNGSGASQSAAFWEGSSATSPGGGESGRRRFDALYTELRKFQAEMESTAAPLYEGPYESGAWENWAAILLGDAGWISEEAARMTAAHIGKTEVSRGKIKISGGCEARSEGMLAWELQGAVAKVQLINTAASEFFLDAGGMEIRTFEAQVSRKRATAFGSELQAKLDAAGPQTHPSTRAARVEVELTLESGATRRELLDELRGDRDVDPVLEAVEAFARSCARAGQAARDLFRDILKEPVVDEITPPPELWIPGLTLFRVYERGRMEWPPRAGRESDGEAWVVTDTGRRFAPQEIASALREIHYRPTQDDEAVRAASACVGLLCHPHLFRVMDGSPEAGEYVADIVPAVIREQATVPAVARWQADYEVVLCGYVQAMSGVPQEWVKKWRVHFGPGSYRITEEEVLWTERGRYTW
jgi:hypothetical protein